MVSAAVAFAMSDQEMALSSWVREVAGDMLLRVTGVLMWHLLRGYTRLVCAVFQAAMGGYVV